MSDRPTMNIPFGRPWITDEDREAVARVLAGHILTHGPVCHEFEEAFAGYVGGGRAVTLSSCTAGMHMYYMHLGVGPGDEVIVPAMSHVATVHAVEVTGAKPVFVDCRTDTGNIDPVLVEDAVSPATKAISVVHYQGMPADMDGIMAIAERRGLPVMEDCAVGIGASWDGTKVGLFGDAGCFSFYPSKQITTGEGGMLLAKDPRIAEHILKIRGFHYDKSLHERTIPGIYDVDGLGLNYRMSEMQAALGLSQLHRVDTILGIRRRNFDGLKEHLSSVGGIRILEADHPKAVQSHYLMTVILEGKAAERRNDVLAMLKKRGVGTGVHYPHPLPRLQYYRAKYGYDPARFPNAETIADRSINLPVGPHVDAAALDYIAAQLKTILKAIG